jgi:hypothetical protein
MSGVRISLSPVGYMGGEDNSLVVDTGRHLLFDDLVQVL